MKDLEDKISAIKIENESSISNYYKLRQQLKKLEKEMQQYMTKPVFCVPFLQPGRMVQVENNEQREDFGWGCVINYQKKTNQKVFAVVWGYLFVVVMVQWRLVVWGYLFDVVMVQGRLVVWRYLFVW